MPSYVLLSSRGVLSVSGDDQVAFLQGLVSNDVRSAAPDRVLFSAFLTPQGKYLHDFFIVHHGGSLLLECEAERSADLLKRLKIFRLRSKVDLADAGNAFTAAAVLAHDAPTLFGLPDRPGSAVPWGGGIAYVDPRLAAMGVRVLLPRDRAESELRALGLEPAGIDHYERLRLAQGVPDGSRDVAVEKATLLESNFDELNAIAWDKGCYMGQELTARTKYRGLVKRRLVPVDIDGPIPPSGTAITADGREVGEMRSALEAYGLAVLRLDILEDLREPLTAGECRLRPRKPEWAAF